MTQKPQQELLREAMHELSMTRNQFAERLGIARRRLDNWLLPDGADGWRPMDSMAWRFIEEILSTHAQRN